MKKATRALLTLLVLALLISPSLGFAEAQVGTDAFSLTADNFKVEMASSPAVDVGLALNLNAGLNQAGDRGLWVMDLSGADTNVLTLIAALEDGKVKAYLTNALGGLPYILEAPAEALKGMVQMALPLAPGLAGAEGRQFSGLMERAQALMDASADPAYRAMLRGKVLEAVESSLKLSPGRDAEIELFDERRSAQTYTGATDFAGLWAALPEIFAADPALKALFDEAIRSLDESGALGVAFSNLPKQLKENGNDLKIAVTEYLAGENLLRLEFAMTALEKGAETGTIALTIDNDSSADRPATLLTLATDIHDSEAENLRVSLESSRSLNAGGEDGYFGLLAKTGGAGGGTVAFQLEKQRTDATTSSAATDWALLSLAFISAAD